MWTRRIDKCDLIYLYNIFVQRFILDCKQKRIKENKITAVVFKWNSFNFFDMYCFKSYFNITLLRFFLHRPHFTNQDQCIFAYDTQNLLDPSVAMLPTIILPRATQKPLALIMVKFQKLPKDLILLVLAFVLFNFLL